MLNMENEPIQTTPPPMDITPMVMSPTPDCRIIDENTTALEVFTHVCEAYVEQVIFASGIVTNLLAFITLRRMPISKAVKALLCTFCITDFFTSIFGFTNVAIEVYKFCGEMIYGTMVPGVLPIFITYKIYLMFLGMSSAVLIFTSIMRTYSIINPFDWRNTFNKRRTVKIIVAIAVGMFFTFLPTSFYVLWKACFIDVMANDTATPNTCQMLEEYHLVSIGDKTRYYFGLIGIVLGPGTVFANIVCFILLKRAIKKSVKEIIKMQNPQGLNNNNNGGEPLNTTQFKKSMNINKMFFAVLIINTVCIAPSCVQVVFLIISPHDYIFDKSVSTAVVDIVAEIFLSVLSSYNFWLYIVINRDFRRKFKAIFFRCRKSDKSVNSTESWHRVSRKVKHVTQARNGLLSGTPV